MIRAPGSRRLAGNRAPAGTGRVPGPAPEGYLPSRIRRRVADTIESRTLALIAASPGRRGGPPARLPRRSTGSPSHIRRGESVSYTHLRAHETRHDLVCRLLLEKKKK